MATNRFKGRRPLSMRSENLMEGDIIQIIAKEDQKRSGEPEILQTGVVLSILSRPNSTYKNGVKALILLAPYAQLEDSIKEAMGYKGDENAYVDRNGCQTPNLPRFSDFGTVEVTPENREQSTLIGRVQYVLLAQKGTDDDGNAVYESPHDKRMRMIREGLI